MCAMNALSMLAAISLYSTDWPSSLTLKIAWPCPGLGRAGTSPPPLRCVPRLSSPPKRSKSGMRTSLGDMGLSDAHASALANATAAAIPVMLRVIVCSPLRVAPVARLTEKRDGPALGTFHERPRFAAGSVPSTLGRRRRAVAVHPYLFVARRFGRRNRGDPKPDAPTPG